MKKDINEMTIKDAEYIFNCHLDGWQFIYPYLHGYHENGVGSIIQKFKIHLREANKERLLERFNIDYDKIPNKLVVHGYEFEGKFYERKYLYKIKKIIKDRFNLSNKDIQGSIQDLINLYSLKIEIKHKNKYG